MKKMLMVATMAALSTSAFATKARMLALGQDDNEGSLFMMDSRNVFSNPANVLEMKNYIVTEWGNSYGADASGSTSPRAEGGFFSERGALSYGVYLGRVNTDASSKSSDFGLLAESNRVDFFLAGDTGIQWGVNFYRSAAEDHGGDSLLSGNQPEDSDFTADYNSMGVNAGVMMGDWEVYANIELSEEANGAVYGADDASTSDVRENIKPDDKFEGEMGLTLGASYQMNDFVFYGVYDKDGFETTGDNPHTFTESTMTFGVAQVMDMGHRSHWFWDARFEKASAETKQGDDASEENGQGLGLTAGFETDLWPWLVIRGSVSQDVWGSTETVKDGTAFEDSSDHSTAVAAGASLHYGTFSIDGVIGQKGGEQLGQWEFDSFTQVGATYRF